MSNFIYCLRLLNKPYLKIGMSVDPIKRANALPYDFNFLESFVLRLDADNSARHVEKMVLELLQPLNFKLDGGGGSEYFRDSVIGNVVDIFKGLDGIYGEYIEDYFITHRLPLSVDAKESDSVMKSIAKKCQKLRLSKNITQAELCEITGIASSTYKKFEQTGEVSLERLSTILIALKDKEFMQWVGDHPEPSRGRAR